MLYDKRWDEAKTETAIEPWRRLLLDAADEMERRGQAKFLRKVLSNSERVMTPEGITRCATGPVGSVCLLGAMGMAAGGEAWAFPRFGAMEDDLALLALASHLGLPDHNADEAMCACVHWNNAPERTEAEVVAAFRGAAVAR